MLESLVTTLLSLDFYGPTAAAGDSNKLIPNSRKPNKSIPSRCLTSSSLCSSSSSSSSEEEDDDETMKKQSSALSCVYHEPPPSSPHTTDCYYSSNDTVFGSILRGELPAQVLEETPILLAFSDIRPRAPLHALIIPKAFVGSVFDLLPQDLEWLVEMQRLGRALVEQHTSTSNNNNNDNNNHDDYRLCFHVPPFHSVDHLHLHVLAPVSEMNVYDKYIKYNTKMRWCISLDQVIQRLQQQTSPVPYRRPPCCPEQRQDMTS